MHAVGQGAPGTMQFKFGKGGHNCAKRTSTDPCKAPVCDATTRKCRLQTVSVGGWCFQSAWGRCYNYNAKGQTTSGF